MLKKLFILLILLCAFALTNKAQTVVTETTKIDAAGLKTLLPTKDNQKPVLINFWATWCPPCHAEFPDLVKIDADYKEKGLVFNVVSVDETSLIETKVPEFLKKYSSTMPSYLMNLKGRAEIAKAIKQIVPQFRDMYPLTLLFDKNGKLVYQKSGRINPKLLRAAIDKVIPKS